MAISKAVIIGAVIIGACVLANLGYTISRDRAVAETTRHEQERQAKAAADGYRRVQSKEAWKQSLKFIDVRFTKWLGKQMKLPCEYCVSIEWAGVKCFDLYDIQWDDAQHVTVHGNLLATPKGKGSNEQLFSWTRKVEFKGDGVDYWWQAEDPVFDFSPLTKDQYKHMLTQAIIMPDYESPLIR